MMKENSNQNIREHKCISRFTYCAQKEFYEVIESFILPLCDTRGKLKLKDKPSKTNSLVSFDCDEDGKALLRFFPCISSKDYDAPFYLEIGTYSSKSIAKRMNAILREIVKVLEYNCYGGKIQKQRSYGKSNAKTPSYKSKTLQLAFELGMCSWIVPNKGALVLHSILCRMEEWSAKTYEGKRVPFGFVIDFNAKADDSSASYLHFLDKNCSAVFTDGVFSGIRLDRDGKLLSFLTRNTPILSAELVAGMEAFVPHQFSDIAQHCFGNAIGVILQTNGEIILVKDRAICFAKRGGKWVSFEWDRVYTRLRPYFLADQNSNLKDKDIEERIKVIYKTLLDVSFSHIGGCLAIVLPNVNSTEISKVIKDRFDLEVAGKLPEGVSKESKEKIKVLRYLLSDGNSRIHSFFEIDAPLRKEIMSLDGATVVSPDGLFYCAGSIVAVPGGSSGGGRTAAAKKLAQLGVGIKISEDGDIEAYGLSQIAQSNHSPVLVAPCTSGRIVPIFKLF